MSARLSSAPIQLAELVASVTAPGYGGITTFLGVVRDHHAGREVRTLEYSAYDAMAGQELERIVREAEERWPCRAAVVHRTGTLAVGDTAVAIAVAAGHRGEAFEACRYVIEELKRRVPIWKREVYADGSGAWVDPTAPGGVVA